MIAWGAPPSATTARLAHLRDRCPAGSHGYVSPYVAPTRKTVVVSGRAHVGDGGTGCAGVPEDRFAREDEMKKKLGVVLGLIAGSMLFGGCLNGYPEDPHAPGTAREPQPAPDPYTPDDAYDSGYDGNLILQGAHLSGDMGSVRDFDGDATSTSGYQYGPSANITVTTTNESEGYSAMAILDLEGGVDNPALVPGARFHFDGYGGGGDVHLYVTGCSGPREGSWVFDAGADDVTLEVQAGSTPDTLRMIFDASFAGNGTTEGSFE